MENKGQNIDDLFREGLGDYAETPPPAAWDRLQQQLKNVPAKPPVWPNRKYGYLAMIVLLLLLGASVVRIVAGTHQRNGAAVVNEGTFATGRLAKNGNANTRSIANKDRENGAANTVAIADNTDVVEDKIKKANQNDQQLRVNSINATAKNNRTAAQKNTIPGSRYNPMNKRHAATANHRNNNDKLPAKKRNINGTGTDDGEIVYNSGVAETSLKGNPELPVLQPKDQPKATIAQLPKPVTVKASVVATANATRKKVDDPFNLVDFGIKAGYETGFDNDAAKKAVISPYLQLNLSPKLAVMLQPAIKAASLDNRRIGTAQGYYKVNNDGKIVQKDSTIIPVILPDGGSIDDTLIRRDYIYSQSHDSILKTNTIGGSYTEFELPILLKYNLSRSFSVYGGVNMVYSRQVAIKEHTTTTAHISRTVEINSLNEYNTPAPAMPPVGSVIRYTGTPYSSYAGPQYSTTQSIQLRYGYMLGFTYQCNSRWLVDALVQQTFANSNMQSGYNINTALSAAYLRLTLGYKLTK